MYSNEETKYITKIYTKAPNMETVRGLAIELSKSVRSIIGKLSKEGVYRKQSYVTKLGEAPITKIELSYLISDSLGIPEDKLEGLEKSPKHVLKLLLEKMKTITTEIS